eukprot:11133228-Alexandrium_andersonii.AAC.1
MQNPRALKEADVRSELLRGAEAKLREALVEGDGGADALPPPIAKAKAEESGSELAASAGVNVGLPVRFTASGEVISDACVEARARGIEVGQKVVPNSKCKSVTKGTIGVVTSITKDRVSVKWDCLFGSKEHSATVLEAY